MPLCMYVSAPYVNVSVSSGTLARARDGESDPTAPVGGADDLIVIALQSAVRQPLTRINRSLLPDARVATRR